MRVTLYCNSDGFSYSINWGGTCPAINVDQQKVWQSMIQAAYLSGRKLNVWWDNACGSRAITAIQMI